MEQQKWMFVDSLTSTGVPSPYQYSSQDPRTLLQQTQNPIPVDITIETVGLNAWSQDRTGDGTCPPFALQNPLGARMWWREENTSKIPVSLKPYRSLGKNLTNLYLNTTVVLENYL
jgi:hypothetical protein